MARVNSSTLKALDILEMLAEMEDGARLTDLAADSGYPISTVRRLLAGLIERGYVEQNPQSNRYHLGTKILTLQTQSLRHRHVGRIAYPHLSRLRQQLNETVNLGIMSERSVIYLETLAPEASFSFYTPPGTRMPLAATAMGKIFLAYLPSPAREMTLKGLEMKANTPHTVTALPQLEAALTTVRARGYAVDEEEFALGIRCVAAPIFGHTGQVVAGVSVTGLATRLSSERDAAVAASLIEICRTISHALGLPTSEPATAERIP